MLSNLSLRGGHRPTWQSRSTRTDHRKATGENVAGCRRFPRRFAPRNDKPVCLTPPNYYCNTCDCLWRSLSAATDAIGAYHFTLTSMGRKCLPEIATGAKRPRNDTSGSAKVHQRPCTVELPRTGRSAGLSPQLMGLKILKYCAAVGGFAALRMRHAPCGYTKYSCVFHTLTCQKISRHPLLLI